MSYYGAGAEAETTANIKTVTRQKRISREDLRNNPDTLYVFGDNDLRKGLGGQAKAMRGEPNAVGVRTKKAPNNNQSSFYTDETFDENIRKIDEDMQRLFDTDQDIVIPTDGIGTGLSRMGELAPRTLAHIEKRFAELEAGQELQRGYDTKN